MRDDGGHHEITLAVNLDVRAIRRDAARDVDRVTIVPSGGESGGFPRRVDATHLH